MCGITGRFESSGRPVDRTRLLRAAARLEHRGPDDVGLYLDGPFGMAATRLAIVDAPGGGMPVANETGQLWAVQNGEIYNAPDLRLELEALGHTFASRSDTEVLVHGYEAWGTALLERLNGAFAFALWDERESALMLARDRFGIRPLFYAGEPSGMAFGSELDAVQELSDTQRDVDVQTVADVFSVWGPLEQRSFLEGVKELPAGHWMRLTAGRLERPVRWWDLPFGPREGTRDGDLDAHAEELTALLEDAVRIRLRSDVPVGSYLSGGIDSAVVAAIANGVGGSGIPAFGLTFEDAAFDESSEQQATAEALGLAFTEQHVTNGAIADAFPDAVQHAAMPILRTAPAPMYLLAGLARQQGRKVVLSGEGADELFGGYAVFKEGAIRRFWGRQPHSPSRPRLLERMDPHLARPVGSGPTLNRSFFAPDLDDLNAATYAHGPRFRTSAQNLRFLHPEQLALIEPSLPRLEASLPSHIQAAGPLGRWQTVEIRTFLQHGLLHAQADRMLMAHGVEGRFPFLDHRVAEFAASLPERERLRGLNEKRVLRRAAESWLPSDVVKRPKRPYRASVDRPFAGATAPEWVHDTLAPDRLMHDGLFDPYLVGRLAAKLERAQAASLSERDGMALVGILSTSLLRDRLVARRPSIRPASPGREVHGPRFANPAKVATA